jgi:hypothetical protein
MAAKPVNCTKILGLESRFKCPISAISSVRWGFSKIAGTVRPVERKIPRGYSPDPSHGTGGCLPRV